MIISQKAMKGQENWLVLVHLLREWTISSKRNSSQGIAKGPGLAWPYSSYAWSSSCRKTGWFRKSVLTTNRLLASPTTTAKWPRGTSWGGFFSPPRASLRLTCILFSFTVLQMSCLEYCSLGEASSLWSKVSDIVGVTSSEWRQVFIVEETPEFNLYIL